MISSTPGFSTMNMCLKTLGLKSSGLKFQGVSVQYNPRFNPWLKISWLKSSWLKFSRLKFLGLKLRVENRRVLMFFNPITRLSEVRISFRIWKLSQSYSNYWSLLRNLPTTRLLHIKTLSVVLFSSKNLFFFQYKRDLFLKQCLAWSSIDTIIMVVPSADVSWG